MLMPRRNTGTIHSRYRTSTYTYTTYVPMVYSHACKFRVFVDPKDRITTYDLEGDEGGCSTFASQLSK